jgi:predicted  nucleic acid-binding Zn-ribbon protein
MAALYDRLRKKYKSGAIIAEVVGGACEECQIDLRLAFLQRVESEPDSLFLCEECGRVLHYNPPVKAVEG